MSLAMRLQQTFPPPEAPLRHHVKEEDTQVLPPG